VLGLCKTFRANWGKSLLTVPFCCYLLSNTVLWPGHGAVPVLCSLLCSPIFKFRLSLSKMLYHYITNPPLLPPPDARQMGCRSYLWCFLCAVACWC
jgi:hypothetical protein